MKLHEIDEEIRKVCPHIHGVSESGAIDFKEEATLAERAAAASLMKTLLPSLDPVFKMEF